MHVKDESQRVVTSNVIWAAAYTPARATAASHPQWLSIARVRERKRVKHSQSKAQPLAVK